MIPKVVVLDTNVFVAAGFKRRSAAAIIVEQVRVGALQMVWHEQTLRETEHILDKIPPLSWPKVAGLFREENCYLGELEVENFAYISDCDDRKYAALSDATGAILLTNDSDLLDHRDLARVEILTPSEYRDRYLA